MNDRIQAMREGGQILAKVKQQIFEEVSLGDTFEKIESAAQRYIKSYKAVPNFSTIAGYDWATCIMKNDALCHGIPKNDVVESGDLITVDVGLLWKGYHLDTTTSFAVGDVSKEVNNFLEIGKRSLNKAIRKAKPGRSVYDISAAMQRVVERAGCSAIYQLTGHGIGKQLHMEPSIPCVTQRSDKKKILSEGDTLAIEIMYAQGEPDLVLDPDGWTYRTKDSSLSAMFEETVLLTKAGPEILTRLV